MRPKKRSPVVISLALAVATIACGFLASPAGQIIAQPDQLVGELEVPGQELEGAKVPELVVVGEGQEEGQVLLQVQESASASESPCQIANWEIIPLGVYEVPQGDGWKLVLVHLAARNNTPYWGGLFNTYGSSTITTEDGFEYRAYNWGTIKTPDTLPTPYSGIEISPSNFRTPFLPPRFVSSGDGYASPYIFAYQVAESQENFTLNLNAVSGRCILPSGEVVRERLVDPVAVDLSKIESISFPTDGNQSQFGDLGQVDILDVATFNFSAPRWVDDSPNFSDLWIDFSVHNSQGYQLEGSFGGQVYLIGNDGVIRYPGDPGTFNTGPGQVEDSTIGFFIGDNVQSLKFVWVKFTSNGQSGFISQVFDIDA